MPNPRVLALAAAQDRLITRVQAVDAGMSRSAIAHAGRRGGPWQRVHPSVYATFSGPLSDLHRLRAALLRAGSPAVVTGGSACALHGLRYGPVEPGALGAAIDLLVPHPRRPRVDGAVRVWRTTRFPAPAWWVDEDVAAGWRDRRLTDEELWTPQSGVIPVAPVARAVVDTVIHAAALPAQWQPRCSEPAGCPQCWRGDAHDARALRNVRALMCEAVQRRVCSVAALGAEVAAAQRRGSAVARHAFGDIEAGCRSAPECELRDLVLSSRVLPEPRWNRVLPGARGIYPDACWDEARLVVEVDSRAFHGFGDAPERTEQRRARYAELGWLVLPVSPTRLRREPPAVLREIEAAYRAGLR